MDGEGSPDPTGGPLSDLNVDLSGDSDPIDPKTATKIETEDGGVVIYIGKPRRKKSDLKFDDNLAETLPDSVLGGIADDLCERIAEDDLSRKEWLETRARGIELMGLKIEAMRSNGADGSAPLEGQSQVRATLLAEAVVRFGANAFSELCPSDGPVKVSEDTSAASLDLDDLADALEKDLNHYLTVIDKPWVPDTDAMLLRVGLDGCVFKKVYHDPILRRPVSRAVFGEDLIVNNSATSTYDAGRMTHRLFMRPSIIKRMMLVGAWRDIELGDPGWPDKSEPTLASEEIGGVRKNDAMQREDRDHEFYESYCELDIEGFEHEADGEPDGLPLPYKVTVHRESRQIVEIRRNWREDDEMMLPKDYFVQFPFIRGFGFYGVGLSHLLGNLTNGITAAWREFVDAGMFANFPGLLVAKGTGRQNNNIFRIPPGGAAEIETGGLPIQQVAMGLPYKSPDAVFVGFIQTLNQEGQRLGGTAEVMVGEGRQDAPVGTTLALIEQAIKPLLATHKRLCAAQSDELQLLVERFREDPEAFVRASRQGKPKQRPNPQQPSRLSWDEDKFLQAINENQIVTRADPNTASHIQRMLRNAALYQMAKDDPQAFNVVRIRTVCIRGIGFADPQQYLNQNPTPPPPDPKAQADAVSAQADLIDAQAKAAQIQHDMQWGGTDAASDAQDRQNKLDVAKIGLQKEQLIADSQERQTNTRAQADVATTHVQGVQDATSQARDHAHEQNLGQKDHMHEALMTAAGQQHDHQLNQQDQAHEANMGQQQQAHEAQQTAVSQDHEATMGAQQQEHDAQQGQAQAQTQVKLAKMKPKPAAGGAKKPRAKKARGGPVVGDDQIETPMGVATRAPDGHHYVKGADGKHWRVRKKGG
jgi:hypothetical protein